MPGHPHPDVEPHSLTVREAVGLALAAPATDHLRPMTVDELRLTLGRLCSFCEALGVTTVDGISASVADRFISAANAHGGHPRKATRKGRRGAVRHLFRALRRAGLAVGDPTLDLQLGSVEPACCRPLTDKEIIGCERAAVIAGGRLPAALALAEASAASWEIAVTGGTDVDLPNGTVRLAGTVRVVPRTGILTPWGSHWLGVRIVDLGPGPDALVYRGNGSQWSQHASSCEALAEVLRRGAVSHLAGVRVGSIRAWAGRRAYEANGIEAAATVLGCRSLDAAARIVGVAR